MNGLAKVRRAHGDSVRRARAESDRMREETRRAQSGWILVHAGRCLPVFQPWQATAACCYSHRPHVGHALGFGNAPKSTSSTGDTGQPGRMHRAPCTRLPGTTEHALQRPARGARGARHAGDRPEEDGQDLRGAYVGDLRGSQTVESACAAGSVACFFPTLRARRIATGERSQPACQRGATSNPATTEG